MYPDAIAEQRISNIARNSQPRDYNTDMKLLKGYGRKGVTGDAAMCAVEEIKIVRFQGSAQKATDDIF